MKLTTTLFWILINVNIAHNIKILDKFKSRFVLYQENIFMNQEILLAIFKWYWQGYKVKIDWFI